MRRKVVMQNGVNCFIIKQQLVFDKKIHFKKENQNKNSDQNSVIVKSFVKQKSTAKKKHHDKHNSNKQRIIKLPVLHLIYFFATD